MGDFSVIYQNGLATVRLPTRVDVTNTHTFVDTLQSELDVDHLHIILNFEETQAIDSTALGALVQVYKTLRAREGTLSLCHVGSGVKRVLAITRVDRIFKIYDNLSSALKAAATQP